MAALLKLKDQGKISAVGVSNATVEDMTLYGPIASDRKSTASWTGRLRPMAPWPIASGTHVRHSRLLAAGQRAVDRQAPSRPRVRPSATCGRATCVSSARKRRIASTPCFQTLQPLAAERHLSVGQLVIAWTLSQPGMPSCSVGSATPTRRRKTPRPPSPCSPRNLAPSKRRSTPEITRPTVRYRSAGYYARHCGSNCSSGMPTSLSKRATAPSFFDSGTTYSASAGLSKTCFSNAR